MRLVAVFGVLGCDVDVPSSLQAVDLRRPECAGMVGVWWGTPGLGLVGDTDPCAGWLRLE